MTLFNIGDVLTPRYGSDRPGSGYGKPSYKIVGITDTQYETEQYGSDGVLNGNLISWDFYVMESYQMLYSPPPPSPAKGEVYNLNYPASAENGETITINASVLNKGGTSGEFSLRLISAPQMVLLTRYVGWIAPYRFSVLESLSVTMPSSGASANLGVQCIRHT